MRKRILALAIATLCLSPFASAIAEPRTATLEVANMTCALCPVTVKKAITRVPGVLDARVDYDTKTAVVRFDGDKTNVGAITAATSGAGYPSRERP
jgi:mercuric ion binding protein